MTCFWSLWLFDTHAPEHAAAQKAIRATSVEVDDEVGEADLGATRPVPASRSEDAHALVPAACGGVCEGVEIVRHSEAFEALRRVA